MDELWPADRTDPDVALLLRSYETFARGDIEQAIVPLHPDVGWIEPDEFPNGGRHNGATAVREYLRGSRSMWAELVSETTPYRHGDDIVIIHHASGRTVDGSIRDATVADVYTIRNGQVTRMKAHADPAEAFGVVPESRGGGRSPECGA